MQICRIFTSKQMFIFELFFIIFKLLPIFSFLKIICGFGLDFFFLILADHKQTVLKFCIQNDQFICIMNNRVNEKC